jgi:methylmalonyl-CoA/ethylmalonyl-CoA epimerase
MIIDDVGIVVKSIEKGMDLWTRLFGYQQMTEIVINSRQKVRVLFLKKENSIDIKLIEPTDSSSSVFTLAQRGGGLHHLCFKCDDVNTEL